MESEWNWFWKLKNKIISKGMIKNEIWRIWWTICTTRTKEKIK